MINQLQKLQLEVLIESYTHCISRFDSIPNEYSERQAIHSFKKLNEFIDSITEKELDND